VAITQWFQCEAFGVFEPVFPVEQPGFAAWQLVSGARSVQAHYMFVFELFGSSSRCRRYKLAYDSGSASAGTRSNTVSNLEYSLECLTQIVMVLIYRAINALLSYARVAAFALVGRAGLGSPINFFGSISTLRPAANHAAIVDTGCYLIFVERPINCTKLWLIESLRRFPLVCD
jgi:hypothetical protein